MQSSELLHGIKMPEVEIAELLGKQTNNNNNNDLI